MTERELTQAIADAEAALTESPEARFERLQREFQLDKRLTELNNELLHREFVQGKREALPVIEAGIANMKKLIEHAEAVAEKALASYITAVNDSAPYRNGHLAPLEYERKVSQSSRDFSVARAHVFRHRKNLTSMESKLAEAQREVAQIQ